MKHLFASLLVVLSSLSFVAVDAEAGRLGGARTSGLKRQTPPPQQAPATPAQQAAAAPAQPAPAAAPATPKRSWLGPLAGLAAGFGLAALMSHFGLGAELGSIVTMLLLAAVAFFAVRWLLRRFSGAPANARAAAAPHDLRLAGAGAPAGMASVFGSGAGPLSGSAAAARAAGGLPAGFDAPDFERIAKLTFIRMQAANDAGDLDDLRRFSTPEMFATFRLDLQERGPAAQQTDVVQLEAEVVDAESTPEQQIVSVRFHGLIREGRDAPAAPFDEVWHLVKPADGSREWAIAGIAQRDPA